MAVAPGFIDIHSHADGSLFSDPRSESVIRQGVTTIVVGQDGGSRFPSRRSGDDEGGYATYAALAAAVDKLPSSVNVASMIGLGSIRGIVVGADDRPATPAPRTTCTLPPRRPRDATEIASCRPAR